MPRDMSLSPAEALAAAEARIAVLERALGKFAWCKREGRIRRVCPWNLAAADFFDQADIAMEDRWTGGDT